MQTGLLFHTSIEDCSNTRCRPSTLSVSMDKSKLKPSYFRVAAKVGRVNDAKLFPFNKNIRLVKKNVKELWLKPMSGFVKTSMGYEKLFDLQTCSSAIHGLKIVKNM